MNYQRVYDSLISSRRARESTLVESGEYVEKHHILPRKLNGGDSADNLIFLRAEDHIHAHILLAKIHGRSMWAPLAIMLGKNKGRLPTKLERKTAAFLRRNHGLSMRGENNPFFGKKHDEAVLEARRDKRIYLIFHPEYGHLQGTKAELSETTGIRPEAIRSLVFGECKSFLGWMCPKRNPHLISGADAVSAAARAKQKPVTLYHYEGYVWNGLPADFPHRLNSLLCGAVMSVKGWYLDKDLALTHEQRAIERRRANSKKRGDISGKNNPNFGNKYSKESRRKITEALSRGLYITPVGNFRTLSEVSAALGISRPACTKIFENPTLPVSGNRVSKKRTRPGSFFHGRVDLIGKPLMHIGFGFKLIASADDSFDREGGV